jgi:uncharacterized membrane protein YeaQ/YmgE (transglycosylase-associated protein family)
MRLKESSLGFIINFLLGVAWAAVLIGAVTSFLSFYSTSLLFAIVSAFIGALPGLIGILLLEYIITNKEKHEELTKQTRLLQQILDQKENKN